MSTTGIHGGVGGTSGNEDAVEALLEKASPRPVPPQKDEEMIREAVLSEWQAVTGSRRIRIRVTRFAVAATVLLGVAVSFNMLQENGIAPLQVATISKSHGSIYVLGEQSQMHALPDRSAIMQGQTIKTDHSSGIGLEWANGGSLRIAADTLIEFTSNEEVYLRSGRIYFDSTPSELIASISGGSKDAQLRIRTDHGAVTHLGTQFMTYTASDRLEISVREGEVAIAGKYHDEKALAGQQLVLAGSARASVLNIDAHGDMWSWVEETSPAVNTDGRSVHEFLNWVSRETGLEIEYPDADTEQAATEIILKGNVNLQPTAALDFWVQGQDLNWHKEGGIIKVSAIDGSSEQ
jgi:hypothetical protein